MRALLVHDHGGPPLRHLLPPWQARAAVAVYVPRPPMLDRLDRALLDQLGIPALLDNGAWDRGDGSQCAERIVAAAQAHGADALCTVSELYSVPTAEAADRLGLRGPSPTGAWRARDKLLMREALSDAGFTVPRYRAVSSAAEAAEASAELGGPLLLKPRLGMSAAGIQRIDGPSQAHAAFEAARASLADFDALGGAQGPSPVPEDRPESLFLVEDLLVGDPRAWYGGPGLSDQVCVEAVVNGGRFVPMAITDVLPKVPPFTQSGHVSPTSLTPDGQARLLEAARRAVDGLSLSTCAVHAELKLMPDGDCAVIEVAARFPGRTIVPQTNHAYGTDLVGALADALLHGRAPGPEFRPGAQWSRAAATVHLYPSEYLDRHDGDEVVAYAGLHPVAELLPPSVRVAAFRERPPGSPLTVHAHEQSHWLAQVYLEGGDLATVRDAVRRLRSGFRPRTAPPVVLGAARPDAVPRKL